MIEDLIKKLVSINDEKRLMREKMISLRRELWDTESKLIELSINSDRIKEEIRIIKNATVSLDPSERDIEIEKFREKLPELLEKLEEK